MSCDRFHPCERGVGVEVVVPVQPLVGGYQVQPGMVGGPGYQQVDPLRQEARHIADELASRDPRVQQHAMAEIYREVHNAPPGRAIPFDRELREETSRQGVQDPLYGQRQPMRMPDGRVVQGESLILNDPFHGTQVIDQFPLEQPRAVIREPIGPGYPRACGPNNTVVDGVAGALIGGALGRGKGALIGGVTGAVVGNVQDQNNCRY
jgi:Glycine zipper